jgi:hypothetical protein
MSIRHYGATFAVGTVLAIAAPVMAPVAQAHVADGTILSSASTSSRTASATALKALDQRWVAIARAYRLQQQDRFLSLRP